MTLDVRLCLIHCFHKQMDKFIEANSLQRIIDCHREIYLTNRTKADKLKTILRYKVN